jgi:dihydrolipoamide dehydrogenase
MMTDVPEAADVLVVGGGPGGYVAAIRAAQLGEDVVLVEADAVGGVCLNYGCIPSKALVSTVGSAHEVGGMADRGVYADPQIDVGELVDWKDGVVRRLTGGVESLLDANGVTVVEGRATFVDEGTAAVAVAGRRETLTFEHAVVATGSRPIEIPGFSFDDDPVLSSRDTLALREAPDHLLVVGAGYIGMELSTVFAKAGTDVEVVEALDGALPAYEDDVARIVREHAEDMGIDFHFGEAAQEWFPTVAGDTIVATETEDGERSEYDTDAVLVAVGREPVSGSVTPEAAGLAVDDRGFLETDDYGRTTVDSIYAVGDVAGEPMLAHEASQCGVAVAETIAGEPTSVDSDAVPAAVFTEPEIATVGYTAAAARDAGHEVTTGKFPFSASGRAMTTGREAGFVRVVVGEGGDLLGAQIVGEHASELIAEVTLAARNGVSVEAVAATVHTHPTLSEAVKEACEHALGHAIHTAN